MSNIQLFADGAGTPLAFANTLKIAFAAQIANPELQIHPSASASAPASEVPTNALLVHKPDGKYLIEPNAVVRYLLRSFNGSDDPLLNFESTKLYSALKSGSAELRAEVLAELPPNPPTTDLQYTQIIVFASLYALTSGKFTVLPEFWSSWASEISANPAAASAVSAATRMAPQRPAYTGIRRLADVPLGIRRPGPGEKLRPIPGERNVLITSALPYVNNVPHLGNIVGSVLSADIYARYCKSRNVNTLFICGTDEYGTATETKALEDGVSPQQLVDKYHKIHKSVYDWFGIGFDYFGRTTTPKQTQIAQDMFLKLHKNGFLQEESTKQLFCPKHGGFLADRYVEGVCPRCGYPDARGDQCDGCGNLLDPFDLIDPRCKLDGAAPQPRMSTHVFLSLDKLEPEVAQWVEKSYKRGKWSKNAKTITDSWLKEGLHPRCITRDLKWGTPVPLPKFAEKVLYVWFDAPIGYVSMTACYTDEWKLWWQNPEEVQLYQFMGKDNVPFHTVVFPASELGTRDPWTMLYHLSTTEYLQYEGGKFSKSRGIGVFGNNAADSGVPPCVWRYYLATARPETSDTQFSWSDFGHRNNGELLANLGNFVNRVVKFVNAKYGSVVPEYSVGSLGRSYDGFVGDVNGLLKEYNELMESVHLRKGLEVAMQISARGNQFLQENKLDNSLYAENGEKAAAVVAVALNLIYIIGSIFSPFMPSTAESIYGMLNVEERRIPDEFELVILGGHNINKAVYLFKRYDEKFISGLREKYGGKQEKEGRGNSGESGEIVGKVGK